MEKICRNMESDSNSNDPANQDDRVKPLYMYQYLQQLGDRQKEAIEKFYHALDKPCGDVEGIKCEDSLSNMTYFGCSFLSPVEDMQTRSVSGGEVENGFQKCREPYNPNIVGPKSCEYCRAKSTLDCDPRNCERPKLYFIKKKPPFENSRVQWTFDGYSARDIEFLKGLK
jgi:hypothetical protein